LFARCAQNLNDAKFVGIVGTRNATEYGKEICHNLAYALASIPNLVIISGLAYGIDICAHKAALDYKIPTVGVVAHGLDVIYPSAHRAVAVRMLEQGGIVTEYLSKTKPDRQNFVQRNRIIAGMSDALIVVESAQKGGALSPLNWPMITIAMFLLFRVELTMSGRKDAMHSSKTTAHHSLSHRMTS